MKAQRSVFILAVVFVSLVGMASCAWANLAQVKIIKSAFPGKDKYGCTICHVAKLPKKDAHELNDYGKKAKEAAGADKMPTAEIYQQVGDPDAAK